MNPNPDLTRRLYGQADKRAAVRLIDVGCSGGVESHWQNFGSCLQAIGFDPLIAEVFRLNAGAPPAYSYRAASVGCREFDTLFPQDLRQDGVLGRNNNSFHRTSAAAYAEISGRNYIREAFNKGAELVYSDEFVTLDEVADAEGWEGIDFLKTDTDGHEIEVLLGGEKLLQRSCLGISVEMNMHGATHPYANTLGNIDGTLRNFGFTIIDIEPFRYTRAALPGRFVYDNPAQTVTGGVQWADGLYARDLADPLYEAKHGYTPEPEDILKLAAFYDIFGLQDYAADLLTSRRALIEPLTNVDELLDLLVPEMPYGRRSYADYIAAFQADPNRLFPSRIREGSNTPAEPVERQRVRPWRIFGARRF